MIDVEARCPWETAGPGFSRNLPGLPARTVEMVMPGRNMLSGRPVRRLPTGTVADPIGVEYCDRSTPGQRRLPWRRVWAQDEPSAGDASGSTVGAADRSRDCSAVRVARRTPVAVNLPFEFCL